MANSEFVIRHFCSTFSAPAWMRRSSLHLSRPAMAEGFISERGRKDRQYTNRPLNEESWSNPRHNNKCQEPLTRPPAARAANASSNPPKVFADADLNFSVTPKTRP